VSTAKAVLAQVKRLRAKVAAGGETIFAGWAGQIVDAGFLPAARNLAEYLALRHEDLHALQARLAAHGLSSLGRSEGHVMVSLDALIATLARVVGTGEPPYPPSDRFAEGRLALQRAQFRLFGPDPDGPHTRVMVTLPSEAATDGGSLARRLVEAGMACARINCAHDDATAWQAMIRHVREAAMETGRACRVLMDIGGPKCRIETVHAADRVRLFRGNRIAMVRALRDALDSDAVIATISFPVILDRLEIDSEVWINDGHIGTRVIERGPGRAELEVFSARAKGERLKPEKGVNFPGTELDLGPLTAKDLVDLEVVAADADMVGFSFVQRVEDVRLLQDELARRRPGRPPLPLVLKIETRLAVRNLPRLIVQAGARGPVAVMIARGDLAVELGFARLSEIQEEIMWLCEAAHVPVVWATQVLDALVSDGLPTRAEATDAAMSQRAECVMLNKGPYVVEAVRFLNDVLRRMDRHHDKKSPLFGKLHSWPADELAV
jgi:pyruvate kinase